MRKFKHTLLLRFTQLKTFISNIEIKGISETTWR